MEEKERYELDLNDSDFIEPAIIDTKRNIDYTPSQLCKICDLLNYQDKQIKELEAENGRFRKYYQEAKEIEAQINREITNSLRLKCFKKLLEDFNYNNLYDYDFVKVAIVCSNYFKEHNWDYETILTLAHLIKKSYEADYSDLSAEEQGYIQQYAENFIKKNEKEIVNIVEEK